MSDNIMKINNNIYLNTLRHAQTQVFNTRIIIQNGQRTITFGI